MEGYIGLFLCGDMAEKRIKVLFLESHYKDGKEIITHSVDYARIINVAKALEGHPEIEVTHRKDPIKNLDDTPAPQKNWDEVCAYFDLIYTSYIDFPTGYVHLAVFSRKYKVPHITDVDDNLWVA